MKKVYIQPKMETQLVSCQTGICEVGSVQGNLNISLIEDTGGDPI